MKFLAFWKTCLLHVCVWIQSWMSMMKVKKERTGIIYIKMLKEKKSAIPRSLWSLVVGCDIEKFKESIYWSNIKYVKLFSLKSYMYISVQRMLYFIFSVLNVNTKAVFNISQVGDFLISCSLKIHVPSKTSCS